MENREQEPATPVLPEKELDSKIIDSKIYNLLLENEEFELTINLTKEFLEFKLQQKNIINDCYFKAKYDLPTLNKILFTFFKEIQEVFNFYDKILNKKKVKLIQMKDKNIINLNFKNIVNFDEEVETNLELEQIKLNKDDIFLILVNEVNSLKKKLSSKNEKPNEELVKENEVKIKGYIEQKINESKQEIIQKCEKFFEDKIREKDNEIKQLKDTINKLKEELNQRISEIEKNLKPILEERKEKEKQKKESEKYNELNDNVNLINNFTNFNINNMKTINVVANNLGITHMKSVAVYKITKNTEILYELAYPDNKNGFNIIIYNLISNKITNRLNNAHKNPIHRIKHYYYASAKTHLLLTSSSDKSIKLWNISSNQISGFMSIDNCFDGDNFSPFCLMFNNSDYYICGGSRGEKKKIWNKNGIVIGPIEKSNLNYGRFIEATYIDYKPYIILSGEYHSESYDYINNDLKMYKSQNKNQQHLIANLFKKNNTIYLICGDNGGNVMIFDYVTTNEISSISVEGEVDSLCSINEKYILVGKNKGELKVIDFDNKSIVKNYQGHNDNNTVFGIEKFKTPKSGEFIITYNYNEIKVWQ